MSKQSVSIQVLDPDTLPEHMQGIIDYVQSSSPLALTRHPRWLHIFSQAMQHEPYVIQANVDGQLVGALPLVYMQSFLFGKRLVSLPYVNTAGVKANSPEIAQHLVKAAMTLADRLRVKALELRHEERVDVQGLSEPEKQKIQMRLSLPATSELLWKSFDPKVRNQIRKGEKAQLTISWGSLDELGAFYDIFARNMRDLGTPVFGVELFATILTTFPKDAEVCIVRQGSKPVAASLLLHGKGITEVPSASSLREYNSTCANMLMYWHLLQRSIERQQTTFDFGRSSPDSPTYQFKKQWGAQPVPAVWQYYLRKGSASDLRPDNPKFQRIITLWKKIPVSLSRIIGPAIARGIP